MSSLFSASLCTVRYDVLPAFWPERAGEEATRRLVMAGCGLYLVVIVAGFLIADAYLQISFASSEFLALLFAFYCAQLAFVPLVLGPVMARTSAGFGTVSARWALVILGVSAVMGLLAVTIYVATRNESWLWAAVPACLGSGFLLFVMARRWPGKPPAAA
jgi:hypothetical protein